MSESDADQFYKLADSFINLANEHYQKEGDGKVGYAMLYAAARFNAFIVATTAGDKAELAAETAPATDYFTEQYRKMFSENLEDYHSHFEQYI
jgi:hypothetical protein